MKRYGFKFSSRKDGTKTKAIDLRYYSIFGSCFFGFFVNMFNPGHTMIVGASLLIFWMLGYLSEWWPKIFFYVTGSVATVALSLVFLFDSGAETSLDWVVGLVLTAIYFLIYVLISIRGIRRES